MLYSKGTANLKPFHIAGSRFVLVLDGQRDGLPVGVLDRRHVHRRALLPTPRLIASGIGLRKCVASYSLLSILSRMRAQPAVFTTSTFSPCFS